MSQGETPIPKQNFDWEENGPLNSIKSAAYTTFA